MKTFLFTGLNNYLLTLDEQVTNCVPAHKTRTNNPLVIA